VLDSSNPLERKARRINPPPTKDLKLKTDNQKLFLAKEKIHGKRISCKSK
jgi:hypothetical protein